MAQQALFATERFSLMRFALCTKHRDMIKYKNKNEIVGVRRVGYQPVAGMQFQGTQAGGVVGRPGIPISGSQTALLHS